MRARRLSGGRLKRERDGDVLLWRWPVREWHKLKWVGGNVATHDGPVTRPLSRAAASASGGMHPFLRFE